MMLGSLSGLSCAIVIIIVSTASASFPIRIESSSVLQSQCSNRPPSLNSSHQPIYEMVNSLLTDKYGAPQGPICSCASNGFWKRVAILDFSNTTVQCPSSWARIETPVRGCKSSRSTGGCDSATFSSDGFTYNQVCGKVIGYQKGTTDAFEPVRYGARSIEQPYVDGLSLTHGSPGSRQHIWTFVSALYESDTEYISHYNCECINTNYNWPYEVPSFIGTNYFCDTGNPGPWYNTYQVYSNDPLWDGNGCSSTNTCCQLNNPPWFCASLSQPTTDDLELRICTTQQTSNENIIISSIEIYVSHI